jgi:hypothetical protein
MVIVGSRFGFIGGCVKTLLCANLYATLHVTLYATLYATLHAGIYVCRHGAVGATDIVGRVKNVTIGIDRLCARRA